MTNQSKQIARMIIGMVMLIVSLTAILAWYDWKLLVVLVLWTTAMRIEDKL